jgi:hypothetical protein
LAPLPHSSEAEAQPRQRILEHDEARAFVIYDTSTGDVLAMHRLHAPAGLRAPADATVEARVLKCAAATLGRHKSKIAILHSGTDLPRFGGKIRIDPQERKVGDADDEGSDAFTIEPGTRGAHLQRP